MNPAEQYILNQPEPFRSILFQLQVLIESEYPKVELKYKWKIPYYYLDNKPFCFLNVTKGYVDVGFWMPNDVPYLKEYLVCEKRKVMRSLRYYNVSEIDPLILSKVLKVVHKHYQKGFKK